MFKFCHIKPKKACQEFNCNACIIQEDNINIINTNHTQCSGHCNESVGCACNRL